MRLRQLAILAPVLAALAVPAMAADPVPLAAHSALYRLTMDTSRGSSITGARGTMAYEITDVCDAWMPASAEFCIRSCE